MLPKPDAQNIAACEKQSKQSEFIQANNLSNTYLWNKEKCFLLHFQSSLHSWNNQILTFHVFKWHDVIKCLSMKHKIHFIIYPEK